LRAGFVVGVGVTLASCSTQRVAWHAPGEASHLDTASAAVFEGEPVLAARGDADAPEYAWRDQSLNIRALESQWQDAMWPERSHYRGHYRRFSLPRTADTVIYYEHDSYSSSSRHSRPHGSSWGRSHGHSYGW
jgi:hypothetical protein